MAPLMIVVASDETTSSLSQIISAVEEFVTRYFLLVSDWVTGHLPEVREWAISHPFYMAATIVGVLALIFLPWIVPWIVLALQAMWFGLKTTFQIVWCSLQWLGQAVVACLGFGVKGVTRGSIAALYQSRCLGGFITAGSTFALFQSVGAKLLWM